jgi:hypothetical protein
MPYVKKNWLNRIRQYANRFNLKDPVTGATVATYDMERVEGTVSQVGTPLSPGNMNDHEDAIYDAVANAEAALAYMTDEQHIGRAWPLAQYMKQNTKTIFTAESDETWAGGPTWLPGAWTSGE